MTNDNGTTETIGARKRNNVFTGQFVENASKDMCNNIV